MGSSATTSKEAPQFESWGRYPKMQAEVVPLHWTTDFPLPQPPATKVLPVGLGRSYGDVCLLEQGTLLKTSGMDRLLHFDAATGVLRCETGASLQQILDFAVPRGFFLPVTPGTKYVTVGGAIANDIHGKNHHVAGAFGRHVLRFELVRSDGTRSVCSPVENPEWFAATIGGMGLTGLMTWAEIRLRPIVSRRIQYRGEKFHGIDEFFALSQMASSEYTVAWIDCVSTGSNFARGIFMQGDHAREPGPLTKSRPPKLVFPVELPPIALNRWSMAAFNSVYFHKQIGKQKAALVDYEPFFYPLDAVLHWNRMYGRQGLLQFQNVIPLESGREGMIEILKAITKSGLASFLAVIKFFGDVPSVGMMSFPTPGVMLALDFPIRREVSFDLVERLARITMEHGGRMYSAKDARMTAEQFQRFYPQWQDFARFVDPGFDSAFWQRVTGRRPLDG
ncbi:MAG TPA: FAD-binding oxidoreductase [Acidobacteriaceae bacterium]|jgi:FAD/FMN-containing dehydrogenase|nr:FAD-binding oxidoreductase [Acidobacteriaceae bacterium]